MEAHFVNVGLVRIATDGSIYNPSDTKKTLKEALRFETQHRVLPDSSIPNSIGYPTIQGYLNLEAASGFVPVQVAEFFIVTTNGIDNILEIINNIFSNIGQVTEKVNVLGNVSGNQIIDLTLGNVVTATLTGPGTWTIQNQAASGMSSSVKFYLTNAGVNITWAVVPQWVGNIPPIFSVAGTDILILSTVDGGVTWFGSVALGYP